MNYERVSIYILELKNKKYYVGSSSHPDPNIRIRKHFLGKGSSWTKLH
jgi:predicted GIY-YIG superfamily endonuclease